MIVTSVTVRVPAKINLQLAVGPLRPDGYHGLVTVFHAVSLFDDVTVAPAETDSVTVSGEGAGLVPENGDNLALRAVRALREALAERAGATGAGEVADAPGGGGVAVTISKRIPVAGGMAGGSADAAAALVACNELWGSGLSQGELCAVASRRRQRRGLRGAGRDSRRPRPRRTANPRPRARRDDLPLGARPSRRPPVHPKGLPRARQATSGPASRGPELSAELMRRSALATR